MRRFVVKMVRTYKREYEFIVKADDKESAINMAFDMPPEAFGDYEGIYQ